MTWAGPRGRRIVRWEESEQHALAVWLDAVMPPRTWFHVPNERGGRSAVEQMVLVRLGVKAGVPDNFILLPPPVRPEAPGCALEMKRRRGADGARGRVRKGQREWITSLESLGWVCAVCEGAEAAIVWLRGLGYGAR